METNDVRVRRSVAEKRRIVELTYEPGMSVARVAQAEGVNANQVFQWRRAHREGGLIEAGEPGTALLPVVVTANSSPVAIALHEPERQGQVTPTGVIHIELPGRVRISIGSGADRAVLQAVLESLQK